MTVRSLVIKTPRGERKIGQGEACFIVAEMSGNHHQNFAEAVKIVKAAAAAGADAIKLQTYTPDTITMNSDQPWFMVRTDDNPDDWKGQSLYELYQKSFTPWEWHRDLRDLAHELGLVCFSTPFDTTAVDFLETLAVPMYKIASYECTHIPLLKKVAATGKPVIMSVGFATKEEIDFSVKTLRAHGAKDIALLHCVTSYAANPNPAESNLRTMLALRDDFDVVCGFSDNNAGMGIPVTAALLGASIIEKHFILDSAEGGLDAQFSLRAREFKNMVEAIREAERTGSSPLLVEAAKGVVHYGPQNASEAGNIRYRQSLFVVRDMKKGEIFTQENLRCIRPGNGLETRYYDEVLGKTATADIERGTPLSWNLIV